MVLGLIGSANPRRSKSTANAQGASAASELMDRLKKRRRRLWGACPLAALTPYLFARKIARMVFGGDRRVWGPG
jgi:hypothetical protein